jgi:hypothetical protein
MSHVTAAELALTSTTFGSKSNPVKVAGVKSPADVTVRSVGKPAFASSVLDRLLSLPTTSTSETEAVHVPPSEYCGSVTVHENVPFVGSPEDGEVAVHSRTWKKNGDVNEHVASPTPARSSETVISQSTWASAMDVSTADGTKVKSSSVADSVSHAPASGGDAHSTVVTKAHTPIDRRQPDMDPPSRIAWKSPQPILPGVRADVDLVDQENLERDLDGRMRRATIATTPSMSIANDQE